MKNLGLPMQNYVSRRYCGLSTAPKRMGTRHCDPFFSVSACAYTREGGSCVRAKRTREGGGSLFSILSCRRARRRFSCQRRFLCQCKRLQRRRFPLQCLHRHEKRRVFAQCKRYSFFHSPENNGHTPLWPLLPCKRSHWHKRRRFLYQRHEHLQRRSFSLQRELYLQRKRGRRCRRRRFLCQRER